MVPCENSAFKKKKRNLIELDIIKTRVDGAIGIKLFLNIFHPQIEAGALRFARIYKAGAERVKGWEFCIQNKATYTGNGRNSVSRTTPKRRRKMM